MEAGNLSPENRIIHQCCQQVVGRCHGMGITGKVDIDLVLGHHPGHAAAGAATLDAENGTQGGLPQRNYCLAAQLTHSLGKPHRRGSLALAGGSGRNPGNYNQLSLLAVAPLQRVQRNLGLVVAVGDQVFGGYAQLFRDLGYWKHTYSSLTWRTSISSERAPALPGAL